MSKINITWRQLCFSSAAGFRAYILQPSLRHPYSSSTWMPKKDFVPIALFVCATIAVKALLEAVIGLRLLQAGRSATCIRAPLDAGESARHGSCSPSSNAWWLAVCSQP
jgi:hypothetical protein